MKKPVIAVALIFSLFFVNTALGKMADSRDESTVANLGAIDIMIVEKKCDCNCGQTHTDDMSTAVSSLDETLRNLKPCDNLTLSYKIVNNGCIDVVLDGVNVIIDNGDLAQCLDLKWTVTQYKDSTAVNSIASSSMNQPLMDASGTYSVSCGNIVLDGNCQTDDYCIMELQITFNDNKIMFDTVHETSFFISPSFSQY